MEVYQKSKKLAVELHDLSMKYPKFELWELGSQLRRAALSIPLNIAESKQFYEGNEKKQLNVAYGSAGETIAILDIIYDLKYINKEQCDRFTNELQQIQKIL